MAQAVAEDLVQQGLAHRVQGAGSWSYVATEHAQAFYPASSAPPVGHRQIEQASALPWVDHQGQVQQELFTLLARRAISAAIRSPGRGAPALAQCLCLFTDQAWPAPRLEG